jgi:membrane protease YdiL (CAAX protease family)
MTPTPNHLALLGTDPPARRRRGRAARRSTPNVSRRRVMFLATFLSAWFALDRLVTSPVVLSSATLALAASGSIVLVSERLATGLPLTELLRRSGLRRPVAKAAIAAVAVGGIVVATYLGGAAALGIDLAVRSNWPTVLGGALVFHGIAEELVWRGYVYGSFRRRATARRAIARSMPLIALTHVPIIIGNGLAIGSLAVLSAAVTCLPLAHLYDRGGRSIWPPAILHFLIGTWQLFERTYPVEFSMVVLLGSIVAPLATFLFGDRFFATGRDRSGRAPATAPAARPGLDLIADVTSRAWDRP